MTPAAMAAREQAKIAVRGPEDAPQGGLGGGPDGRRGDARKHSSAHGPELMLRPWPH